MPKISKIKQYKDNKPQQASRSKPCPPKLAHFINLVNVFPLGFSVTPNDFKDRYDLGTTEGEYQATLDCLALLQPNDTLNEYMNLAEELEDVKDNEEAYSHRIMTTTIERYKLLEDARLTFIKLILSLDIYRKSGHNIFFHSTGGASYFFINDAGEIEILPNPLEEALDGVEAARIRRCEACRRVFWAGRMTQKGCSARCGDIIRKRRHRERYRQGFYQGAKLTEKEKTALLERKQQ